jgi:5'-AMP-activated protein kinase catalytic alpha subunit
LREKHNADGVFEKVKRELKILRRFNNPHTIKLFEFIDTQSEIFMVLEYAAGGELFDLIARKEKVRKYNSIYLNLLLAI